MLGFSGGGTSFVRLLNNSIGFEYKFSFFEEKIINWTFKNAFL